MKGSKIFATAAICAGSLIAGSSQAQPASAGTVSRNVTAAQTSDANPPERNFTDEDYQAAFENLKASSIPRTTEVTSEGMLTTFGVNTEVGPVNIAIIEPTDPENRGDMHTQINGGTNRYGVWIGFNQFDQNALSNTFAAAAITAAICAVPGVGVVLCTVAGAAVSVAVTYIHRNGVCSNGRTLYWYDIRGGSTIGCLDSPPR